VMELSQMCVQGLWDRDPVLMQLPHISRDLARKCTAANVESVFDLMDMEDDERTALLGLTPTQLTDMARVCNCYPNIELSYELEDADEIVSGESATVRRALLAPAASHTTRPPHRGLPTPPRPLRPTPSASRCR